MTPNRKPFRVLFVCMGNICRSPAAEIIFRHLAASSGRLHEFEIDSAGTLGYHTGSPPDPRMADTLRQRGYPIAGSARQITRSDLESFDLIVTMDDDNLHNVRTLDRQRSYHHKIKPLVEFCQSLESPDVPDPYYGGQQGFEWVADLLEDGCAGILNTIPRDQPPG